MKNLSKALVQFQAEITNVPFDAQNPHFKNRYATLAAIIDHAKPILNKHGFAISQLVEKDCVTTMLIHESGESLSSNTAILCAQPNNPQSYGSAVSYARRYSLTAILGIASDDLDDDATLAAQKPQTHANALPMAQKANPAQPPAQNGPMLFKAKLENGTYQMVTVDKLTPSQLKWYSTLCQEEAKKQAAQAYIKANFPSNET